MAAAIGLREDFDAKALRALAKRAKDGPQARRLLALAAIYDGATRSEAGKIGGVTLQIVRDWVLRFNALGPEGLVDRKAPGQPSLLNDEQRLAGLHHGLEDWDYRLQVGKLLLVDEDVIPTHTEADSRGGFPNRWVSDSTWQTGGGSPCRLRLDCGKTLTQRLFGL